MVWKLIRFNHYIGENTGCLGEMARDEERHPQDVLQKTIYVIYVVDLRVVFSPRLGPRL